MKSQAATDIDSYIEMQPSHIRLKLIEMRQIIKSVVPDATEVISYQMPAFKLNKVLVYFAGCKNHIGFYPSGTGISAFEPELSKYVHSKGAIQFPLDQPLPVQFIKKIVKFRRKYELEAAKIKSTSAKKVKK